MIGQHQNDIELVLANNDAMALGAIDAYKKLNYTESTLPVFLGIDGTAEGLQAVRDGSMYATVYNDKEKQAEVIAELAVSLRPGPGSGRSGAGKWKIHLSSLPESHQGERVGISLQSIKKCGILLLNKKTAEEGLEYERVHKCLRDFRSECI